MQTASGHHGPDTQELVFGKMTRTNFECRMKHQYSPYCEQGEMRLLRQLKHRAETNMALDTEDCAEDCQKFSSDSEGSSLHLQQHIAADACRQTSVPLLQFSTRKTLTANKHDITG